jgi:hypothetical protein
MTSNAASPSAKTAAQRQARRRQRLRSEGEHCRVNLWIGMSAYLALQRLARRDAVTQAQIIERLILNADNQIVAGLELDAPEWDNYFLVPSPRRRSTPEQESDMT